MTPLCEQIVRDHQMRKGRARKAAFRRFVLASLRKKGVFLREERARGLIENVNLVCGNVERASIVIGAHYDTCARMPFPNLAMPLSRPLSIFLQLGLIAALFLGALACGLLVRLLGASPHAASVAFRVAIAALCVFLLAGPANRHTMNDNTSGVVAALTLLERMTPGQRRRVAVVLFDNEEIGLVGSTLFRRRHRRAMARTPLINLDCVGDGRSLLFAASRAYREDADLYARTRAAFAGDFEALHVPAARAFYPSDQWGFAKSLAVAALNKRRFGYALERIHTRRDTVLAEENIEYLVEGLLRLIGDENE